MLTLESQHKFKDNDKQRVITKVQVTRHVTTRLHPSYDKMNEHGHEEKGHVKKGGSRIETQRGGHKHEKTINKMMDGEEHYHYL